MKNLYLFIFFSLIFSVASGQPGIISGKTIDELTKKPLAYATVTIFKSIDTTLLTYRLSNEKGDFKVPGLPLKTPLRLVITFSGYEVFRKEFSLTDQNNLYTIGSVTMKNTSKTLDEVIVIAERPPVIFKKDTIEFNASAFKTLPNALLEDLLKKLPGVNVTDDGSITVNGVSVNRILVDGKRFFGDDTKMATRNLPSNYIDKVQVTDDKEEIELRNNGDLSSIGKVINLTLKRDIKKGWFGKLFAGGGSEERYEVGGIANVFRDTLQLSIVSFSNNQNRSGFSLRDVMTIGGFGRSGINSVSSGPSGLSVNGVNFGGGSNGGILSSSGGGININHAPNKNLSFFGQYFYGSTNTNAINENNISRFIEDTNVISRSVTSSIIQGRTQILALGSNWKVDSLTNINFKIDYSNTKNQGNAPTSIIILNDKLGQLSEGNGLTMNTRNNESFSQNFSITRRSRNKRSRQLALYETLNINSNPEYNTIESKNQYFYPSNIVENFNQYRVTKVPSTKLIGNLSYSDLIMKNVTLRLNSQFEYNKIDENILTYGIQASTGKYDSLNYSLSSSLRRVHSTLYNSAGISYLLNKVNINARLGWNQQWIANNFGLIVQQELKQYISSLLPYISLNWKRYNASFIQLINIPSITYLSPIPDNTNPYNIVYGNTGLLPSKTSTFNVNGTYNNSK